MGIILGIDIGGSTTKIVGLDREGAVSAMLRVRAEDQLTSLFGALGNFLTTNRLALGDVERVVLTGVGASYVNGDIYSLPTRRVSEFNASGTGALALSGISSLTLGAIAAAASAAARWEGCAISWWAWSGSARSKSWPAAAH